MARYTTTLTPFEWEQRLVASLAEQIALQVLSSKKGKLGKRATRKQIATFLRKNSTLRDLLGQTSDNRLCDNISYMVHRGAIPGMVMTSHGVERAEARAEYTAPVQGKASLLTAEIEKARTAIETARTPKKK